MGTHGPGRKRLPNRERLTAEDDALDQIVREAESRLAEKRTARAEARDIRMRELERQHKERSSGLDTKWGHIEKWMEESERYSRHSRRHTSMSDDEEKMSVGSRGSFKPSDYSCFMTSSSRASSRASSARASPVVEERPDRDFMDKGSRASTLSAVTLASLGGGASRRGSDTSVSVETEASIRDIKECLSEAELRYRRAMVANAQLSNEKTTIKYELENLRDELGTMEETLWESRARQDATAKELQRERQTHSDLQFQFREMKETLRQTEELLTTHGVVVSANGTTEGHDVTDEAASRLAEGSSHGRQSMLELRLKKVFEEREILQEQVERLQSELEECVDRQTGRQTDGQRPVCPDGAVTNGTDAHLLELQRDSNRQVSELKFKLVKSEQEVVTLEQSVIRLEGQVTRYKMASENSEKMEDDLKVEKRRLHRELRCALDRIDELEVSNSHLTKRLDKKKANRNALLH